jgi:hypothetical protein
MKRLNQFEPCTILILGAGRHCGMRAYGVFCLLLFAGSIFSPSPAQTAEMTPEQIIKAFSAKETEAYEAWMQYIYRQTSVVQVTAVDGAPKNEKMTTTTDVVFKDDGSRDILVRRREGNIRSVTYTMEDEEVINNLQPFALTEKELPQYNLKYMGKEKIDELTCHVFSVTPKDLKSKNNKFYFEGKIWVDEVDLQIVRTVGKPVPQKKNNLFPDFETIRQRVDGKYWFPVWTHAESDLNFKTGVVHIEETIEYKDYKKFQSKIRIQYDTAAPQEK